MADFKEGDHPRADNGEFRQGAGESHATPTDLADALEKKHPGLKLDLGGSGSVVTLSRIVVPKDARSAGAGSAVMKAVTDWADKNGKTVALSPSSDFGGSKSRLVEFYKRFGFVENKGREKDHAISETMHRTPKGAANDAEPEPDSVGRIHYERRPISKAQIDEYKGDEIPGYKELGLSPDVRYKMLRCPKELAAAASTFNGIQLLHRHVPVSVDDHRPYDVVGALGTNAEFEDPYLYNDISVWTQAAIDGIEDKSRHELSSSYHYTPDMTPGTYKGEAYDGVMRAIAGNHTCLIPKGRVGPDVALDEAALEGSMLLALDAEINCNRQWAVLADAILAMDEVKHDPKNGQFSKGGGSGGGKGAKKPNQFHQQKHENATSAAHKAADKAHADAMKKGLGKAVSDDRAAAAFRKEYDTQMARF